MRFRSELLQPPKKDSKAFLTRIYDVYRSPDGHIAGDEEISPATNTEDPSKTTEAGIPANVTVRNSRSRFKTAISEF